MWDFNQTLYNALRFASWNEDRCDIIRESDHFIINVSWPYVMRTASNFISTSLVIEASNPSISRRGVLVFALQESHGHPIWQALDNLVFFGRNILYFIASLSAVLTTIASGQELVVAITYETQIVIFLHVNTMVSQKNLAIALVRWNPPWQYA